MIFLKKIEMYQELLKLKKTKKGQSKSEIYKDHNLIAKESGFNTIDEYYKITKILSTSGEQLVSALEDKAIPILLAYKELRFLSLDDQAQAVLAVKKGLKWFMYAYPEWLQDMYINKKYKLSDIEKIASDIKYNDVTKSKAIHNINELIRQKKNSIKRAKAMKPSKKYTISFNTQQEAIRELATTLDLSARELQKIVAKHKLVSGLNVNIKYVTKRVFNEE